MQSGPESGPVVAQSNTDKAMIGNRSKADPHANRSERRLRAHRRSVQILLRAHAARIVLRLLKFDCRNAARKPAIRSERGEIC